MICGFEFLQFADSNISWSVTYRLLREREA